MSNSSSGSLMSHPAGKFFIGLCLWQMVAYGVLFNSFSLFIKPIATGNEWSITTVSVLSTLMSLFAAFFLSFTGRLMNKVNSRTWFTTVAILIALVMFGFANAVQLWHFYTLAAIFGILCALGIFITAQVTVPNWFAKPATYMGIAAAFGGVGAIIAAPIISRFLVSGGYQAGFMFQAVVALVVLVPMGFFVMRFRPDEVGARPYGIEEVEAQAAANPDGGAQAAAGGVTEAEARKMPQYWLIWLYVALVPMFSAIFIHVPGALGDKGLSLILVGSVVASYQFGVAAGQFVIGWCNDKLGTMSTSILFTAAGALACLAMAYYNQPTIWILSLTVFVLGCVRALVTVHLAVVVRKSFGMKAYGPIFSLYFSIGSFITAGYFMAMGAVKDFTGSYAGVFMIIVGVAIVCMLALVAIENLNKKQAAKATPIAG